MLITFLKNGFRKYMPAMWGLIFIQIITGIPLFYSLNGYALHIAKPIVTIALIIGLAVFFTAFYFMFKNVFNMICDFFETEKLSDLKIVKSLLIIGAVNIMPFFIFFIPANPFFKFNINYVSFASMIFSLIYFLSLSLSLASIVMWKDKNTIIAIFSGVKIFYKKIFITLPLFIGFDIINRLIVWFICVIIYAIMLDWGLLKDEYLTFIHAVINIYPLYIIAPLYLGAQVIILKKFEEKNG